MSEQPTSAYLVDAYSDPVAVKISGRCNYLNCNAFREFIDKMLNEGRDAFAIDFENCQGMDSTFLGILASTALRLRKANPPGSLVLSKLNDRNKDLVCNLGLHRLLLIDDQKDARVSTDLGALENTKVTSASVILKAHESLVEAEGENAEKFQDCIDFLRNQVEEKASEK